MPAWPGSSVLLEAHDVRERSAECRHDRRQPEDVVGPGEIWQGHEDRAHAALGELPVPADVIGRQPGMMPPGEHRRGGPAAQPLYDRASLLPVAADDRDIEYGHLDLVRVPAGLPAV